MLHWECVTRKLVVKRTCYAVPNVPRNTATRPVCLIQNQLYIMSSFAARPNCPIELWFRFFVSETLLSPIFFGTSHYLHLKQLVWLAFFTYSYAALFDLQHEFRYLRCSVEFFLSQAFRWTLSVITNRNHKHNLEFSTCDTLDRVCEPPLSDSQVLLQKVFNKMPNSKTNNAIITL